MKHFLLLVLLVLGLTRPAQATPAPPATGRPLAEMLNPDGTLRAGANGSFDARQFCMSTAPDGRPVFRPTGTKGAGDERWADGFGLPNGTERGVYAVVLAGTDVYIGGMFNSVGNVPANYVAKWNGTTWSALGAGPATRDGSFVFALAVGPNGDVYAGGAFVQPGGASGIYVAKWNGTAWSNLGGAAFGPGIYSTAYVYALAVAPNGDVYAGGGFGGVGTVRGNCVARWDGTAWHDVGGGLYAGRNNVVRALAVAPNGDVYAGGTFYSTGNGLYGVGNVAKWNGSSWSVLGTGTATGTNGDVYALSVAGNGDVYVGGAFTQAGGVAANQVAKWNGTAWSSLGTANGVNGAVNAVAVAPNGDVYAGGTFTQAGGGAASYVAKWNGTAWSPLSTGTDGTVTAVAVAPNGDVYAGGDFTQAGGVAANRVAKWSSTAWSFLGTGVGNGVSSLVRAVAVAPNGDVYVGGDFTRAGGVAANRIAKWNGTAWSSLGTGTANGVNNSVYDVAVAPSGDVYVGGDFTQAGGAAASSVAKWNGTAWSSLGSGVLLTVAFSGSGGVNALAVAGNGDVYVGGYFTQAGGVAAGSIAKWNGTAWSSLGTGVARANQYISYAHVFALAATNNLYVAGNFVTTGDGSKVMVNFAVYDPNAPLLATKAAAKAAPAAQLFPNPAHGAATLRLPAGAPRRPLTLSNALGQVVRRYPAPATAEAALDLRGLPAGAYVVRCGEFSQRLVVE